MPEWMRDEEIWQRAKAQAHKQYPGLEKENSGKFYSIVTTIYKSMGGRIKGQGQGSISKVREGI